MTGILLSYSVNYLLTGAGPANWRWMFASAALPSIAFFLTLLFIPESPRWLMQKGREQEAKHFLAQIVGPQAASAEIDAIRPPSQKRAEICWIPHSEERWIVAIVIALFSQFTGINTIIYYGSIFSWNMYRIKPRARRYGQTSLSERSILWLPLRECCSSTALDESHC